MKYRIGCSGYYYPSWRGNFYPRELQPKDWLAHYSAVFNTVELNGTFYRTPTLASLKRYASFTPDDFSFSVKASRTITHIHRLKESKQLITDFQDLVQEGLGSKLSYFLFQLPPSFHYSEENLERIIANIPNEERNVIEFRHASWWHEPVRIAFEKYQLTFCNVDFPGLTSFFIHTSPSFYLRLHGNPILFKSSYDLLQLEEFYRQFPPQCSRYTVYFNNTYYDAAYTNASQLMAMMANQQIILNNQQNDND